MLYRIQVILLFLFVCNSSNAQDFQWAKEVGDVNGVTTVDMAVDSAGNTYSAGLFTDTTDFDPGPGVFLLGALIHTYSYILKLDPNGNFVWAKQIGESSPGDVYSSSVKLDKNGNVYMTGFFENSVDFDPGPGVDAGTAVAGWDMFVVKLNNDGDFVWKKTIGNQSNSMGRYLAIADDKVHIAGRFHGNMDFDPGPATHIVSTSIGDNSYILTLDTAGEFEWVFTDTSHTGDREVNALAADLFGNIYWGYWDNYDLHYIGKVSPQGVGMWKKRLHFNSITTDQQGNILTCSMLNQDTIDFDPGPGVLMPNAITQDITVQKLDSSCAPIWLKHITSANFYNEGAYRIVTDWTGACYVAGNFHSPIDMNPGVGIFMLQGPQNTSSDCYILKLNANGEFEYAQELNGDGSLDIMALGLNDSGNLFIGGIFVENNDFDPGPGVFNMNTDVDGTDIFVARFSPSISAPQYIESSMQNDSEIVLFPNPSPNKFTISSKQSLETITVTDVLGRVVYHSTPKSNKQEVALETSGIFFVTITSEAKQYAIKVVVRGE